MKISEHFRIYRRAVKLIFRLERRYAVSLVFGAILSAVIPYVPIYFSAKVVDSLYQGAAGKVIVTYAILTVGIVFLLKLLEGYVSSLKDSGENAIWRWEAWLYSEKAMDMSYVSIESHDVALLRGRLRVETQTGYNFYYLLRSMREGSLRITEIVCSFSLTV